MFALLFFSSALFSRRVLIFYLVNFYGTIKFNYRARGECIVKEKKNALAIYESFSLSQKDFQGFF